MELKFARVLKNKESKRNFARKNFYRQQEKKLLLVALRIFVPFVVKINQKIVPRPAKKHIPKFKVWIQRKFSLMFVKVKKW